MKVRLWYQEYIPATAAAAPSHQQLYRMYHSIAGEYDAMMGILATAKLSLHVLCGKEKRLAWSNYRDRETQAART